MHRFSAAPARTLQGACVALAVAAAAASAPAATLRLHGIIRDFPANHPDFNSALRARHDAGFVSPRLGPDKTPLSAGPGQILAPGSQFTELSGIPVSVQAYLYGGGPVRLVAAPAIAGVADTWNPWAGPYGGANVGPAPAFDVGAPMPDFQVPTLRLPVILAVSHSSGTVKLSNNLNCRDFFASGDVTIEVEGNVTIVCHDEFSLSDDARIELSPNSSLKVYLRGHEAGRFRLTDNASVNMNTGEHDRVTFFNTGTEAFRIGGASQLCATVVSATRPMLQQGSSQFYGSLVGQGLVVAAGAAFHHVDPQGCILPLGDEPATMTGAASPAAALADWYRDQVGVNMSAVHTIDLAPDASGIYRFSDPKWFPIDGELLGNEGDLHNYDFTWEMPAAFTDAACKGQFIAVRCSDDGWLSIDDRIMIDLGGLGPKGQVLDLGRLGLEDGKQYSLRLFTAQRSRMLSVLEIATNFELLPDPIFSVSQATD